MHPFHFINIFINFVINFSNIQSDIVLYFKFIESHIINKIMSKQVKWNHGSLLWKTVKAEEFTKLNNIYNSTSKRPKIKWISYKWASKITVSTFKTMYFRGWLDYLCGKQTRNPEKCRAIEQKPTKEKTKHLRCKILCIGIWKIKTHLLEQVKNFKYTLYWTEDKSQRRNKV